MISREATPALLLHTLILLPMISSPANKATYIVSHASSIATDDMPPDVLIYQEAFDFTP